MEQSYLTADFFRKLPQEVEKGGNPASSALDRYSEAHFRRIGTSNFIHFLLLGWSDDNPS
jgi:hypothetical protein